VPSMSTMKPSRNRTAPSANMAIARVMPIAMPAVSIEHIRAGGLRALAVSTATRLKALADLPTVDNLATLLGARAPAAMLCRSMAGTCPLCKAMLMPHYFFNTRIGHDLISDPKGADLPAPDHTWEMARPMLLEILRDQRGQPSLLTGILEVTDERGELVLELPFSEALIAPPDEPPTKH
jgi:hypothetical protein